MECGSEATNIRTVSRFAPRSSLGIPADRRGDDAFARFPASYNEEVAGFQRPLLQVSWLRGHAKFLEAPPGFEPGVEVLQTAIGLIFLSKFAIFLRILRLTMSRYPPK